MVQSTIGNLCKKLFSLYTV